MHSAFKPAFIKYQYIVNLYPYSIIINGYLGFITLLNICYWTSFPLLDFQVVNRMYKLEVSSASFTENSKQPRLKQGGRLFFFLM